MSEKYNLFQPCITVRQLRLMFLSASARTIFSSAVSDQSDVQDDLT